jgi:hypothetical protein
MDSIEKTDATERTDRLDPKVTSRPLRWRRSTAG